ncbi:MAG: indole-3-glycerol-phosphate synthase [Coriobacteriia bacterium]|nr:indole-3-glycerol-phosphate synthase [Coriobacteriia bacterium]
MTARRSARIAREYGALAPADRERLACCARPPRDFSAALTNRPDVAVIAEVKKASPSAGPIAPDCEASKQALHYQDGGAAAISVLTEPESFGGSFTDLSDVADAVDVPVLAKDFVVDPAQLYAARGHGADAVLLMIGVLAEEVAGYLDLATTLGMQALVEVHDAGELELALRAGAKLVGVNSRDMRTLEVDPARARGVVAEAAAGGVTVVSASGVRTRADVEAAVEAGAEAVLVGERLMRAPFPEDVLAELTGVPKTGARV